MADVVFSNLETYLNGLAANTVDTPYAINITGTTAADWGPSNDPATVGGILKNSKVYIDLSSTTIPADVEDLDSVFEKCSHLVIAPALPVDVINMSESFKSCTALKASPVIPESVSSLDSCFYGCKALTSMPTIPQSVNSMSYCFYNCTELVNVTDIPDSVTNLSFCFRSCTSLTNPPAIVEGVLYMQGCFQNCTSLKTAPYLPSTLTNLNNCFKGCTELTAITNFPSTLTKASSYIFGDCTSLYNGGLLRNIDKVSYLYDNTNVQACALLVNEVTNTTFGNITNLKIYTTAEYYETLKASVEANYPNSNFTVVQIDYCLDFLDLADWLAKQRTNSRSSAYKMFIGGGLSLANLTGTVTASSQYASPLGQVIAKGNVFIDLTNFCYPKDANFIATFTQDQNTESYPKVNNFIIPPQTTTLNYTFKNNPHIQTFNENNTIPETVTQIQNAFQGCTNINDIYVNHRLADTSRYLFGIDSAKYVIYAKDYSHFYTYSKNMCNVRRVILDVDYADLDTYLAWFDNECSDVNLKCNGLTLDNLASSGTTSPAESCEFSKKLLGTNITNDLVKGFCASSTFDLRLTEAPEGLTSLYSSFANGNISYCFTLPETVTNLNSAFYSCPLIAMPTIPTGVTNLTGTFANCISLTTTTTIPSTVTEMNYTFFGCKSLSKMPNISLAVKELTETFYNSGLTSTVEIPAGVLSMDNTFCKCSKLKTVANLPDNLEYYPACFKECVELTSIPNVPASSVNLQETFNGCSSLTTINNWSLDVTKKGVVLIDAFKDCTNLNTIYTTSPLTQKEYTTTATDSGWRHITVKPNMHGTYNLYCRNLKGLTTTIEIQAAVVHSYVTDEILFSPNGSLSTTHIENMLNYSLPFGDGLDPSKQNFIVWAKDDTAIKTNLTKDVIQRLDNVETLVTEAVNNALIKVTGEMSNGSTSITLTDTRITADMMLSIFTSEFGVAAASASVSEGTVVIRFDEAHDGMKVGAMLTKF